MMAFQSIPMSGVATTQTMIFPAPPSLRAFAHSETVDPVVITSSMIKTCLTESYLSPVYRNASRTFKILPS